MAAPSLRHDLTDFQACLGCSTLKTAAVRIAGVRIRFAANTAVSAALCRSPTELMSADLCKPGIMYLFVWNATLCTPGQKLRMAEQCPACRLSSGLATCLPHAVHSTSPTADEVSRLSNCHNIRHVSMHYDFTEQDSTEKSEFVVT